VPPSAFPFLVVHSFVQVSCRSLSSKQYRDFHETCTKLCTTRRSPRVSLLPMGRFFVCRGELRRNCVVVQASSLLYKQYNGK